MLKNSAPNFQQDSANDEPTSASVKVLTTAVGQFLKYQGPREIVRLFLHVPQARVYDAGQTLVVPLNRDNVMALEVIGGLEEPDEEYAAAARELLWPSERSMSFYPPTVPGAPDPRWHQCANFGSCLDALIAGRRGHLNAAVMGAGKSRATIDLMRHFVKTRALVIGQKTTLEQWAEELARAWPEAQPYVLHQAGSLEKRREVLYGVRQTTEGPVPVILVNWEALADLEKDLKKFPKFDVVVADEASRLLGRTTKMARAAKQIAWKHAWYALALTGTPIRRGVEDLCALFQFVDTQVFGSRIADFREQYCEEAFTGIGRVTYVPRPEKVVELVRRLYSAGFRVSRAAVDLPEPERRVVRLKPSKEQVEQLALIKRGTEADAANVLARIIRSQQITAGFVVEPDALRVEWNEEQQTHRYLDDPKADWIEEYLDDLLTTEDAKIVVWTKFIPEIEALHNRLAGRFPGQVARIDGTVPDTERQVIRRRFNDRSDELRVLVMNLQTGSLGLDLPTADVLIYHSSSYNFVDRVQSEGRGTRLGRLKPCILIDLVLSGTIDEDIQQNLAAKKSVSDLLTGQGFLRKNNKTQ